MYMRSEEAMFIWREPNVNFTESRMASEKNGTRDSKELLYHKFKVKEYEYIGYFFLSSLSCKLIRESSDSNRLIKAVTYSHYMKADSTIKEKSNTYRSSNNPRN